MSGKKDEVGVGAVPYPLLHISERIAPGQGRSSELRDAVFRGRLLSAAWWSGPSGSSVGAQIATPSKSRRADRKAKTAPVLADY
jgi:hypothetical protein